MPATADNKVLEGKTQRLCPSQTLETLTGILNILFILIYSPREVTTYGRESR